MSVRSDRYVPKELEQRWQQRWAEDGLYESDVDTEGKRAKLYCLTMLPYPSGDLHMGHWYAMTPPDARARFKRMQGYNVFFPMGFDAFGLPAENAAIKRNVHPREWTYANIERMRGQLRRWAPCGHGTERQSPAIPSFTSGPSGSSASSTTPTSPTVSWRRSTSAQAATPRWRVSRFGARNVAANAAAPRSSRRELDQWKFRITDYADELLEGLERIDWPERVKTMQTNWIGRSVGAEVTFTTENGDAIEIFTTRPDTLWGATFMVLAPEHPLVEQVTTHEQQQAQ